jgi:PAS domain S-box-containing protein
LCAATGHHPHAAAIKLDASGCIVGAHDGFHAWAGLRPEEAVGRRLVDLLPAPQRRQVAAAIESTLRDGSPHRALLTLADQDGQEVSGVLSLAPIQIDLRTQGAVALWVRQETAAGLALAPDIDYAAEERAGANS